MSDMKVPDAGDIAQLIRWATAHIPGDTPRLDAETLLAAALGVGRMEMLLNQRMAVPEDRRHCFQAMVQRRRAREPVALILGQREFWSLDLKVTADTLIPRPDSETLVEAALALFPDGAGQLLDLGTGSGALLLAALSEWPKAHGVAVDISLAALRVARDNARAHGFDKRISFVCGDWGAALQQKFDLIFCNPPYVEQGAALAPELGFEPQTALFAGADGLDCYRIILPQLPDLLRPGGVAIFEMGAGQAEIVAKMAEKLGLETASRADLAGIMRALVVKSAMNPPREGLASLC